jgi:hypothetical protein
LQLENSAFCRLHGRQHGSQRLFINTPADTKPSSILEDEFNAGFRGAGILAYQRKAGCVSICFVLLQSLRAPSPVESSLLPVKLAFSQPMLSAEFPD